MFNWNWVRVHQTRFYRLWRNRPQWDVTDTPTIEQYGAIMDNFGNLIIVLSESDK